MLYTIISLDDVFYQQPEELKTMSLKHGYAQYSLKNGRKEIMSFFSTNPYDYLGKIDLKNENNDTGLN